MSQDNDNGDVKISMAKANRKVSALFWILRSVMLKSINWFLGWVGFLITIMHRSTTCCFSISHKDRIYTTWPQFPIAHILFDLYQVVTPLVRHVQAGPVIWRVRFYLEGLWCRDITNRLQLSMLLTSHMICRNNTNIWMFKHALDNLKPRIFSRFFKTLWKLISPMACYNQPCHNADTLLGLPNK